MNKRKLSYVIHFAAESHLDWSIIAPSILVSTDVLGNQVLDAALHVGIKHFVHVSANEVYGEFDFYPTTFFIEE
ncbi:GDP-mannose 4,6-dehydratase [Neobacillus sp. MER 74]|uniref:GDP-mannose 4,6-dehydratase n=1 Tax=Neobacillus sp. MER 74 TaxID=2939566 RepID=UPI00288B5FF9|nr:GDP-mannose 4,6-dehydratase [Neobacillus sp. MER 74]